MRTAIVTGGGQGIGKAISQRLLREGFAVALAEIDPEAGRETAEELSATGAVRFVWTDVSDEDAVTRLVAETVTHFGGIDVLVNNAGIGANKPVTELTLAEWNRVLGTNLTGAFLCAKHAAPHLRARKGCIINIASTRAYMSEPNTEAYSASKGGLTALTHALAVSLGPDVRVNGIAPGWIEVGPWQKSAHRYAPVHTAADEAQHPAGRVGTPEDVAALVAFLAGSESGFITGAMFPVDGGMLRKMIYV